MKHTLRILYSYTIIKLKQLVFTKTTEFIYSDAKNTPVWQTTRLTSIIGERRTTEIVRTNYIRTVCGLHSQHFYIIYNIIVD